jgi:transposase
MHSASGFDRIEVVTGVERRRRWSLGEKLKAVEETRSPGMSVSYVARDMYCSKLVISFEEAYG